jgi:hypothetical protein
MAFAGSGLLLLSVDPFVGIIFHTQPTSRDCRVGGARYLRHLTVAKEESSRRLVNGEQLSLFVPFGCCHLACPVLEIPLQRPSFHARKC